MTFNSIAFALFLPTVFLIHWLLPRKPLFQNSLLLLASYVFYAYWDYRLLALLLVNSLLNFLIGLGLKVEGRAPGRRLLLGASILVNLGTLFFFKYLGFFVASFGELFHLPGLRAGWAVSHVILPLGISYYTLQMLGYTIDVYRGQFPAERNLLSFLLFAAFFPKLVAGPIERAANLLPQLHQTRTFQTARAKDGVRQMLWGFFKKLVIADNLAAPVDDIFKNYLGLDGATLFVGAFLFAVEIYCDFSGYSDIAVGAARLFGVELTQNFAYPYFSRDIAEFWRRWHVSLSTWFRDYVFFPLGSVRRGTLVSIRNVLVTFTLSGLWHGADWTFIVWGLLHGLYFVPPLTRRKRRPTNAAGVREHVLPTLTELRQMTATFLLVMLAWVFFRATSVGDAFGFLAHAFTHPWAGNLSADQLWPVAACFGLLVWEWLQRSKPHGMEVSRLPLGLRWATYYVVVALIFWYGFTGNVPFIYVKF
jgi:alginate O-acetyltransferase complex protein AlgI